MRVGMMPPQGAPQPDAATRGQLVAWLEDIARSSGARAKPNPGRPVLHRLNRAEYANAVRDLLALDVDPSTLLPPDDSAYGFDNVGDVLGVSPVLLERFMEAANKVSALAIGDPDTAPASETFRIRQDASQDTHVEGLPIGTVGGILAKVTLPLDADISSTVKMFRTNLGVMRGLEYGAGDSSRMTSAAGLGCRPAIPAAGPGRAIRPARARPRHYVTYRPSQPGEPHQSDGAGMRPRATGQARWGTGV